MDSSERHERRLRETSPSGQANLRRLSRRLARLSAGITSSSTSTTPTPYTRSTRPSRLQTHSALPPTSAPRQGSTTSSPRPFVESSPPDPFYSHTIQPVKRNKDSPTSIRAGEAELSKTLDSFSSMFGARMIQKSPPRASIKTHKAAAAITSPVKKGKLPVKGRISFIDFDLDSSSSQNSKSKPKDFASRHLFTAKTPQPKKRGSSDGVDGEEDERALTIEELAEKSTPVYASSPSVPSSPPSVPNAPRIRGRFGLGSMPAYQSPENPKKRKREDEGEDEGEDDGEGSRSSSRPR